MGHHLKTVTFQLTRTAFCQLCLLFIVAGANEAAVMLKLRAAINPTQIGWSNSTNYCSWTGIKCDSSLFVIAINLADYSLMGTLPSDLYHLSQLTTLSLQGNSFSGPFPSFANLSNLEAIHLDSNNFSSVSSDCFQGLTSLQTLSLSQNANLGPWSFPKELTESSSLVTLYAGSCNIFGPIPDIFASFPSLQDVKLSYNNLSGFLPPSFAGTGIRNLWLNHQQMGLSGTIDVLSNMTNLCQVWLQENMFTGRIPDLANLDTLFDLQLRDNLFYGVIPHSLTSILSLRNVSLMNNKLQGPTPLFPESVINVGLSKGTNSFCLDTPGVPCDSQVTTLLKVAADLGYPTVLANSWKGNDACADWTFLVCDSDRNIITVNFQRQRFDGTISPALANLTSLKNLLLNENNLIGPIPDILTRLPQLQFLDVSNNNLSGEIPNFPSRVKFITTGNLLLGKTPTAGGGQNSTNSSSTGVNADGDLVPAGMIHEKGGQSVVKAAIAATAAGIGLFVIMLFFCLRKASSNFLTFFWKKNPAHQSVDAFLRNCRPLQIRRFSYLDIKKMTNSFKEKLGEGGFGSVYKGKLHDGCLVAVKVLKKSKANGEEFINEVATISRTSHINIVTLLGFCFEGAKKALVYEFMPHGSLEKFVFDDTATENSYQLDWETHYQISLGIARGLEYLHRGCNIRILHFDIKPHNILLDEEFVPKISDFGLAKICTRKESLVSMLGPRGTIGYIAPEVFSRNFGGVSHKSDVYSYGMMVLEMVGGRKNVNVRADNTSEIYFPHWIYKRLELDEEIRLKRIMNEEDKIKVRKMIIMSLWCIQTDPSNRPTMSKVIEMLEGNLDSLQVPPKPFLSSPSGSPPPKNSSTFVSLQI